MHLIRLIIILPIMGYDCRISVKFKTELFKMVRSGDHGYV